MKRQCDLTAAPAGLRKQTVVTTSDLMQGVRMCAAGVDVREAAKCKPELRRNRRLVIWRANVATWSSCISGAEEENLRRADETLASECEVIEEV